MLKICLNTVIQCTMKEFYLFCILNAFPNSEGNHNLTVAASILYSSWPRIKLWWRRASIKEDMLVSPSWILQNTCISNDIWFECFINTTLYRSAIYYKVLTSMKFGHANLKDDFNSFVLIEINICQTFVTELWN